MRLEVAFRRHLTIAERQRTGSRSCRTRSCRCSGRGPCETASKISSTCVSRSFSKRPRMSAVLESAVGRAGLRVGEVEQPVRREVGVRHHLEQSALPRVEHLRHALDRLRQQLALADDPQPSRPLGDQRCRRQEETRSTRAGRARRPRSRRGSRGRRTSTVVWPDTTTDTRAAMPRAAMLIRVRRIGSLLSDRS